MGSSVSNELPACTDYPPVLSNVTLLAYNQFRSYTRTVGATCTQASGESVSCTAQVYVDEYDPLMVEIQVISAVFIR